ncbi:unnamed protein product [Adineta steineri]|uniref:Helitron helicase-like domain-containing protein n=1 Tax=Adineta steineri TaxID=433720 RepID=A0A816DE91_9BILA|nr:unnamed protein product [Adineta steineri]CAF1637131.1 unnamed protein product [Adineta steineri]
MPIKDYFNPELLLGLYPTLFPYGFGAPQDSSRPVSVSLEQHIRYLLAYDDQRFEKHHSFMFVLFNIMQRRQACWNATLMASRPYFQDAANDLQTLTSKEIEAALITINKKTFSSVDNPRINMLMRQIKTVGGNVMGSAYSRAALRNQIHGLIFNQGLPSIFMTINSADIHSRVALYFAGVDLDLDTIIPEKIPSTYERAQIIASHPAATARFFNVLISSILKCMVEKGVLGPIKAYFGTVENQGRGSLHLHILIWLAHDLTPSQLKESVQNEEFRRGLLNYLEDIIKQDLSDFCDNTSEANVLGRQQSSRSDDACYEDPTPTDIHLSTTNKILKAVQSFEKQKLNMDAAVNAEEKSRRLVLRCYNTLASQQELSGVQVASYLMGWPDHYATHDFVNLFLIGIENYLQSMLSEAKLKQQRQTISTADIDNDENCVETEEQFLLQPAETNSKYVYVNTRVDYQYRSTALDNICLYDYICLYRKKSIDANDRKQLKAQSESRSIHLKKSQRGRPSSGREVFQVGHPQSASHINIERMKSVVPILLGPPIPRKDRDDTRERYYRCISTLFLPWRTFQDVCNVEETWEEAFNSRQTRILPTSWKIINNIQSLQECKNDRDEHLQQVIEAAQTETGGHEHYPQHRDSDSDDENNEIFDVLEAIDITGVPSLNSNTSRVEQIYFERVVQAADQANRFANIRTSFMGSTNRLKYSSKLNKQIISDHKHLVPATSELVQLNNRWQRTIKEEKDRIRNACIGEQLHDDLIENNGNDENELAQTTDHSLPSNFDSNEEVSNSKYIMPVTKIAVPNEITRESIATQYTLNTNQKAAFMIITGHLDGLDKLNEDDKQDQLIMCVPGCGGTGKSQLIRAVTAYFTETNRALKLRKLAPTSVAAAEIEGMTIHSFLGEGRNRKRNQKL